MSFPIKCHLPLITTRVEFEFNVLPPPPQITTRRDFGAYVRRRARHNSVPYSRPRARSRSIGLGFQSDSSLSELSDAEESNDGDNNQPISPLIPKPRGEAGKVNSGGYNLENALGWTEKRYEEFDKYIKAQVAEKLDVKKCFSHQKPADLQETAQKFGIEHTYANNWPIREALKARLKYTSDWEKKKVERKVNAELKEVLRPLKGKGKPQGGV